MAHWSVPPYHVLFFAFELYLSIGSYLFRGFLSVLFTCPLVRTILLLVSSEGQLTFSLDRTALSFFLCCLCFYYITPLRIVNTFLKINLNFFILFVLSFLYVNFQKILAIYLSFMLYHSQYIICPAAYFMPGICPISYIEKRLFFPII